MPPAKKSGPPEVPNLIARCLREAGKGNLEPIVKTEKTDDEPAPEATHGSVTDQLAPPGDSEADSQPNETRTLKEPEETPPQKKTRVERNITDDKGFYNRFLYKLGQAPSEVRAKWAELKGNSDDMDALREFMTVVKNSKKGKYDDSFISTCRSVTNEHTTGTNGEWESW